MDLFQSTFPQGKNLFVYRDAIGFVTSFHRIFKLLEVPDYSSVSAWQSEFEGVFATDLSHLTQYLNDGCEEISLAEQLTLWWILVMESYLAQVERGIPVLAVRYIDLIQFREETVQQIFAYCGLPLSSVQLALNAFDRDSQVGTLLARENPQKENKITLSEEQVQSVMAILQRHPVLNTPDFNAPGTLRISGGRQQSE